MISIRNETTASTKLLCGHSTNLPKLYKNVALMSSCLVAFDWLLAGPIQMDPSPIVRPHVVASRREQARAADRVNECAIAVSRQSAGHPAECRPARDRSMLVRCSGR